MEKKTKVNLLALQIGSKIADIESNISKVELLLNDALSKKNVDIVILPEVWTVGWDCESFEASAETITSSRAIIMLKSIAQKHKVNIIGGSIILKQPDGSMTNSSPVINREGELVCIYDKAHLYSYYGCNEGNYIKVGNSPVLVNLDGVKVGLTICYDIRFPEIYRAYRKVGADLIVNMAAWGAEKKIPWDVMTTSRAVENQVYFVALTQTGELKNGDKNLGHSMIIDYKGDILDEININEGSISATINLEEMYEFRKKCLILNDIKDSYEVVLK